MFKPGDRVKMQFTGTDWCHGVVTIVRDDKNCKVEWDEDWAPDYWWYPNEDLELDERIESW